MKILDRKLVINLGFAAALAILAAIGWISYKEMTSIIVFEEWERHSHGKIRELGDLLSRLREVETINRGFVISGNEKYLEPYKAVLKDVERKLVLIRDMERDNPQQQERLDRIAPLVREKLGMIEETINLRRTKGFQVASRADSAGRDKRLMDEIGRLVAEYQDDWGRILLEREIEDKAKTGKVIYLLLSGSFLSLLLLCTVFILLKREITRRGMVEEELRTHRDNLEHLVQKRTLLLEQAKYEAEIGNRTKSEFLTNMSHEMRTPLTGVLGIIDLLLTNDLTEEQRYFLNMAKTSAGTLKQLINDILELSMIEAGKICFIMQSFDIRTCIRFAADIFKMEVDRKDLGFLLEIDEGIPEMVVGDAVRLRQVLVSLVGNAVKFTEHGAIVVSVRPEQDVLRFVVRDTGIGIPAEYLNSLFEKFTQADASLTRKYGGAGLGLALTKQIVENMGGEISVESRPGEGSELCFTIPFVRAAPLR